MSKARTVARALGLVVIAAIGLTTGVGVAAADATAPGTVSGHLWFDRDGNKAFGPGDRGAWGSQVRVSTLRGAVVGSAVVDQDGSYHVDGIAPGVYQVDGAQAGFAGTTKERVIVRVRSGGTATADFGIRGGRVTGTVWNDADVDGIRQRGEVGETNSLAYVGTVGAGWATRNPDGTYVIDDLPAGAHQFYAQDAAISTPALAHSPGHQGTDRTRDSDFDRDGVGPVVEFRVNGDRVTAVGGPAVLDAGYYRGVNHGTLTLTADRDTTALHVGDTVTITATATYSGNAHDDHGAQFTLPQGLTSTSVDTGIWRLDYNGPNDVWVRDASPTRTAPDHQATIRITATVTAPITSAAITGSLVYSFFLTPADSNSASLPVSAS